MSDSDYEFGSNISAHKSVKQNRNKQTRDSDTVKDDGLMDDYNSRLDHYYKQVEKENEADSLYGADTTLSETKIEGILKVPTKYWNKLYK